jgi:hypothetical protein
MNERIRDLALDALVENIASEKWVFTEEELERFAKLIVGECANQCDLLLDHKMSSEWARGTHDCSRAIKKHFGVEE